MERAPDNKGRAAKPQPLDKEKARELVIAALREAKENMEEDASLIKPYLSEKDLKTRHIVFIHCEDEGCGFLVEFKYPNCTFYFCKEDKMGFNLDLATISETGVECKKHGKMERYDLFEEDNMCPSCEGSTLAILSTGV